MLQVAHGPGRHAAAGRGAGFVSGRRRRDKADMPSLLPFLGVLSQSAGMAEAPSSAEKINIGAGCIQWSAKHAHANAAGDFVSFVITLSLGRVRLLQCAKPGVEIWGHTQTGMPELRIVAHAPGLGVLVV